jgi:dTDP-4-dehydrorhamnose reductase
MHNNILITGASGFIATYLNLLRPEGLKIFLSSYRNSKNETNVNISTINLRDRSQMEKYLVQNNISTIIHCAGDANVDSVERNILNGIDSNLLTTINLVNLSNKLGINFVFISSNAVFDGSAAPYNENSIPNPINKYGLIKLGCEQIIRETLTNYCIIRPILTYGWNISSTRGNPVTLVLNQLSENKSIKMVNDIYENPVYVKQVVEVIWKLVLNKYSGIFHIAGGTILNRYQLALCVADVFKLNKKLIFECESVEFSQLAPRPKNTSLSTNKIESILKIEPLEISEGLMLMREELSKR